MDFQEPTTRSFRGENSMIIQDLSSPSANHPFGRIFVAENLSRDGEEGMYGVFVEVKVLADGRGPGDEFSIVDRKGNILPASIDEEGGFFFINGKSYFSDGLPQSAPVKELPVEYRPDLLFELPSGQLLYVEVGEHPGETAPVRRVSIGQPGQIPFDKLSINYDGLDAENMLGTDRGILRSGDNGATWNWNGVPVKECRPSHHQISPSSHGVVVNSPDPSTHAIAVPVSARTRAAATVA
jgi:hypothetical protein